MSSQEFSEPQLLPQLQAEIRVAKSTRALHPDLLHQHPGYVRLIRCFCFGGKQFQLCCFALLVEHFDSLLPTCMGRTVQFTEITKRALARTIRRSNGLDQRPVSVLLAIFKPLMLSKKHLVRIMSAETPCFKTVGLHYITFSID